MAHIVVAGAGLGGLPTAYELRHLLPRSHTVTLISNTPKFTFIPSLPWVGLDLCPLEQIQVDLPEPVQQQGIQWIKGCVTDLDPEQKTLHVGDAVINYDYLVLATGVDLDLETIPGLGPETGYTHSVCNPDHALKTQAAWRAFLTHPGPLVVGAVPGASCLGPAYEFAFLADHLLRHKGLRQQVPITLVSPEPYVGHLGIGGMANSNQLVTKLLDQRQIQVMANTAITEIGSDWIQLDNGQRLPQAFAMLLPPFRGAQFLRQVSGLTDAKGFLPVTPTYQHPQWPSIYGVGVITQLAPPEPTPLELGVPKTGQMTEAMGMAVAHNIAVDLGVLAAAPVTPTLAAICFADFGDTGLLFLADPVLPVPELGRRRRAVVLGGPWISWSKQLFEKYFLAKMRWGLAVPWIEQLGLKAVGLSLVAPLPSRPIPSAKTTLIPPSVGEDGYDPNLDEA